MPNKLWNLMKNKCKMVPNLIWNLMFFENRFREKSTFLKRVNPRRPLYSCSRIGVGEGSPKTKEIKKRENSEKELPKIIKNMSQKNDWKFIEKSSEKSSKMEPKSIKIPSKMRSKNRCEKWAPPGPERNLAEVADRLPSVVKMKINNLQNIILQAIYLQKTNWRGQPTDIADENLRKRRTSVDFLRTKLIYEGFSAEKWSQMVLAE